MADGMYSRITQAVNEAEHSNMGRKFKQCTNKINESMKLLRKAADGLTRIGQQMEKIAYIVQEIE